MSESNFISMGYAIYVCGFPSINSKLEYIWKWQTCQNQIDRKNKKWGECWAGGEVGGEKFGSTIKSINFSLCKLLKHINYASLSVTDIVRISKTST